MQLVRGEHDIIIECKSSSWKDGQGSWYFRVYALKTIPQQMQRSLQREGTKPGLAHVSAVGSVVDVGAVRRVPVSLEHCLQLLLDCGGCGPSPSLVHH